MSSYGSATVGSPPEISFFLYLPLGPVPGIGDAPHGFPRVLMGAERRKAEIAFTARAEPHAGSPHYAETVQERFEKSATNPCRPASSARCTERSPPRKRPVLPLAARHEWSRRFPCNSPHCRVHPAALRVNRRLRRRAERWGQPLYLVVWRRFHSGLRGSIRPSAARAFTVSGTTTYPQRSLVNPAGLEKLRNSTATSLAPSSS